jgi:hypothetical protein
MKTTSNFHLFVNLLNFSAFLQVVTKLNFSSTGEKSSYGELKNEGDRLHFS